MTTKELQEYVKTHRMLKQFKNRKYDLLLGLRGEVFEFDEVYTPYILGKKEYDFYELSKEEMSDILIYALSICIEENWNVEDIIKDKIDMWE